MSEKENKTQYKFLDNVDKSQIWTIPNILTFFRILLIPIFVYLYCIEEEYIVAIVIAVVAELTDMADGIIARKFNMTSALGKALDPFADKLMQAAFVVALVRIYPSALVLFGLMVFKEILLAILAHRAVKYTGIVSGSKWYGRVSTWIIDVTMAVLLLWNTIPEKYADLIFIVNGIVMIFSLVMYAIYYESMIQKHIKDEGEYGDLIHKYANKEFEVPEIITSEKREAIKDVKREYRDAKKELKQEAKDKKTKIKEQKKH